MSILPIGLLYGGSTMLVMFAGTPIAFGVGVTMPAIMILGLTSKSPA